MAKYGQPRALVAPSQDNAEPPPLPQFQPGETSFMAASPVEIARQLTVVESAVYRSIEPCELFAQGWSTDQRALLSPNVANSTQHFNRVSCATQILILSERKTKVRVCVCVCVHVGVCG